MRLISRSKESIDFKFVDKCVRTYLSYVKSLDLSLSEVSELFRYSMCLKLGLTSKGYTERIEDLACDITDVLTPVFKDYNFDRCTESYKQGLLESCVHCMEMSRKRIGV